MTTVAGIILAGGEASRLGGRHKAVVDFAGVSLLSRVRTAIAGCDPIVVSVGDRPLASLDLPQFGDAKGLAGPLAGVVAGAQWLARNAATDYALTVAVDTPDFPTDFVGRALALATPHDAVVACYAGQDYPTNVLWRMPALIALITRVNEEAGPRSLRQCLGEVAAARLDYAPLGDRNPFANVNTADDLAELLARRESAASVP